MRTLLASLLVALISTSPTAAQGNLVHETTAIAVEAADANDPVERQYRKLLADDDNAREEVDKWIRDADAFDEQGAPAARATLTLRIEQRLEPVRTAYQDFLKRNPKHVKARIAYASFLTEVGEEYEGAMELEKARELDPNDPAIWNNLANYYGHRSPVKKSFAYYARAIELDPKEPVYRWNFATTVYLFRKDAMEFYQITEDEVFDKALDLYRQALKLDPTNFVLASDYAQSFYGTKPPRWEEGLAAWQEVMPLASDEVERHGVHIHLARIHLQLGHLDEARKHLDAATHSMYAPTKGRLTRKLEQAQQAKEQGKEPSVDQ